MARNDPEDVPWSLLVGVVLGIVAYILSTADNPELVPWVVGLGVAGIVLRFFYQVVHDAARRGSRIDESQTELSDFVDVRGDTDGSEASNGSERPDGREESRNAVADADTTETDQSKEREHEYG